MKTKPKLQRIFWVHLNDNDLDHLVKMSDFYAFDEDVELAKEYADDPDRFPSGRILAKVWLGASGNNGLHMHTSRRIGALGAVTAIGILGLASIGLADLIIWAAGLL